MQRQGMTAIAAGLAAATFAGRAFALTIEFDFTYDDGFFTAAGAVDNSWRQGHLEAAGDYVASRIHDTLAAIVSHGDDLFFPGFHDPARPAFFYTPTARTVPADTLLIYSGGRDVLPADVLARGGPGSYETSRTAGDPWLANVAGRGEDGATGHASSALDFGPWGGAIFFNPAVDWHFDADPSTPGNPAGFDFFSVAIHEIAHVLGFGTAPSWRHWTDETASRFAGPTAVDVHGTPVVLAGDDAHWRQGTRGLAEGKPRESALTPAIGPGRRKDYTDLDWAALADVGWEVEPEVLWQTPAVGTVPLPPGLWLLATAGAVIGALARRRPPRQGTGGA